MTLKEALINLHIIMEYEPVTKESLLSGVLTMFKMGALSEELTLHQIKQFANDERVNWK